MSDSDSNSKSNDSSSDVDVVDSKLFSYRLESLEFDIKGGTKLVLAIVWFLCARYSTGSFDV